MRARSVVSRMTKALVTLVTIDEERRRGAQKKGGHRRGGYSDRLAGQGAIGWSVFPVYDSAAQPTRSFELRGEGRYEQARP